MKDLIFIGVFALGCICGWVANQVHFEHNDCIDYSGTYQRYEAWLSVKNGIYRCFWIEKDYPHRVRVQGVIDVK